MSWDIKLVDKNNNKTMDIGNYTYNVNPMYKKALGFNLSELHMKPTKEVLNLLENAVINMKYHAEEYKKLDPTNGWGSYKDALEYLEKLYYGCKKHFKSYIDIS
jgi:hypothetical protein